jgi:hypothetical protein
MASAISFVIDSLIGRPVDMDSFTVLNARAIRIVLGHYHCAPAGFFFAASALSGVLTLKEGHGHDLEIENQTPIFHVPDVVVNPFR